MRTAARRVRPLESIQACTHTHTLTHYYSKWYPLYDFWLTCRTSCSHLWIYYYRHGLLWFKTCYQIIINHCWSQIIHNMLYQFFFFFCEVTEMLHSFSLFGNLLRRCICVTLELLWKSSALLTRSNLTDVVQRPVILRGRARACVCLNLIL